MKRIGNLFGPITSLDNLRLADQIASRGKSQQYGVRVHREDQKANLIRLQQLLQSGEFRTSPYTTFKVFEPKEREVSRLPYYPDRIVHHAIMNVLEPVFVSVFTSDTYSCIKGRGIHAAQRAVIKALQNEPETRYCLKLDIRKFYPSIDHEILKQLLRRKIKCTRTIALLDEIIDSAPGVPIGNYLSQYFANFYLTYFDHWMKEVLRVKHYFRYADDMVILSPSKPELHALLGKIRSYLATELKLEVKGNYQVFPVSARSIDFVGYRLYHTHTLLRKSIKQNFARKLSKGTNRQVLASYMGWAGHCDSRHLLKKLTHGLQIQ